MNKKAVALIFSLLIIAVLIVMGAAIFYRSVNEKNASLKYSESAQAFWLAEAGINKALVELRNNYDQSGTGLWTTSLGEGQYSVDIVLNGQERIVTAHGYIPSIDSARVERRVEATMRKSIPPNFYDNAIYSAGSVEINGNSFGVEGNILYAGTFDVDHPENINGTITNEPLANPLARFDFEQLRALSQSQGNVYDEERLKEVDKGNDDFPSSFWYTRADDSIDNDNDGTIDEDDEWFPNVVYVETDLQLNGNIGTVGGFFAVVGDIITDPDETDSLVINGNGQIDGIIYTRGEFRVNGGGGASLNVNGGVWAGEGARINGSVELAYNQQYMEALQALGLDADVQIISWRDLQDPYPLQ